MRTVTGSAQTVIWHPQMRPPLPGIAALAGRIRQVGGRRALAEWQAEAPEYRVAYLHGERDDLWWEFYLSASFRWQAHLAGLSRVEYRQRLGRLVRALGLTGLLGRRVEELAPEQLALASLGVALMARPDLLVWEEPFQRLSVTGRLRATQLVRSLTRTEGLTVVTAAANAPGLSGLESRGPQMLRALR